jgi:hypothetical protein
VLAFHTDRQLQSTLATWNYASYEMRRNLTSRKHHLVGNLRCLLDHLRAAVLHMMRGRFDGVLVAELQHTSLSGKSCKQQSYAISMVFMLSASHLVLVT